MSEMDNRTKDLLKRRPYLASWFEEKEAPKNEAGQIRVKRTLPLDLDLVERLVALTPSKIAVGRAGTRFLTKDTLAMRAGHAIAKDAVYSEVGDDTVAGLECVQTHSQNVDRENYLLMPGEGRRLDDESLAKLTTEGTPNVDVQIIVGDGLSAWAVERNIQELIPALKRELEAHGLTYGKVIFVRFARVGVQDHIGTLLNSKSTIILLGERPGLGTGDSLSAYMAYGPKMDQDNAEKNCVSNIRQLGFKPHEAAVEIVKILKRAFEVGKGGVAAL